MPLAEPVSIPTDAPVLVTGATGYVAGWVVKRLLDAGATVHAAVRDPGNAAKVAHLDAVAAEAPGTIRYFAADLMEKGSYAEAMKGCRTVFHTASPFTVNVRDPQRELVDPAVEGTRNVLEQADATPSVERVVLTSSCAAIYTDAVDTTRAPGGRITEDVWNETASLDHQPYFLSKMLAEREAWNIADAQDRWRLVVVNPALVLGPAVGGRPTSESFSIMKQAGRGDFRVGAPKLGTGIVDVRDVADAHIAAAFLPDAEGRHIVAGHETDFHAFLSLLVPEYGDRFPLPKRVLPKWLVWLMAPTVGLSRRFVANNVGHEWRADNSKSRERLALRYLPLETTVRDMFQWMIDNGYFRKKPAKG